MRKADGSVNYGEREYVKIGVRARRYLQAFFRDRLFKIFFLNRISGGKGNALSTRQDKYSHTQKNYHQYP